MKTHPKSFKFCVISIWWPCQGPLIGSELFPDQCRGETKQRSVKWLGIEGVEVVDIHSIHRGHFVSLGVYMCACTHVRDWEEREE